MVAYLLLFVTALATSLVITPRIVHVSHRLGLLDRPGGRKVHATPVPRIGGVAIALSLALGLGVSVIINAHGPIRPAPDPKSLLPIISGAALVFAIGLWDDIDPVRPLWKLVVESIAACIVIAAGLTIDRVTIFGTTHQLGWLAVPITASWVLVITNAFNLMDGLDGLAAGLTTIAAATCGAVLLARGEGPGAMLVVTLIGALLGFLVYNFHPAKIFMGDSGSLLAGFLLAVTAITGRQKGATALAVGVPLLIFAVPLADTVMTVVRRIVAHNPSSGTHNGSLTRVFTADRGHIHHRLLEMGLSHRGAVLLLYGLMFLSSAVALLTMQLP